MVQGGEIPYQDSALEKRRENAEQWLTADPEIKCFLPGVPRVMYMPFPFQIVQTPEFILVASEYIGATRSIHMTAVEPPPIDTYMGHSVGRWEGDKLVIETTNFNAKQDGGPVLPSRRPLAFFLGSGETLRRVETYERLGPDQIAYGVTTDDPSVYVEPYTVLRPMILDNDFLMLQSGCHEGNYGMPYILSAARADEDYAMRAALEAAELRKSEIAALRARGAHSRRSTICRPWPSAQTFTSCAPAAISRTPGSGSIPCRWSR